MAERKGKKKPPARTRKVPRKKTKPVRKDVLDERLGHFGEEVQGLGERFGKRMEKKGEEWDSWFHNTFGLVGPLISSIFGIVILALITWVIGIVNFPIGSSFMANIQGFLLGNLGLFFLIFLLFSYSSYMSRASPKAYEPFSPLFVALGIAVAFWVAGNVVLLANISLGISFLSTVSSLVLLNIAWIFGFFLVLGYVVFSVMKALEKPADRRVEAVASRRVSSTKAEGPGPGEIRRLYRSGNDKILGGVCGGIAEYLGVDPVLIRLLWIIGTLAWGAGIIAYIIAWIIIPRNPSHKWN